MATTRSRPLEFRFAALAMAAIAATIFLWSVPAAAAAGERTETHLNQLIDDAIRAGGPLFNAEERALIERKCGYAPGSGDGFDVNIAFGDFHCNDGRRLDDSESRAMMARAQPRIQRRIDQVMHRPDIRAAIARAAHEASAEALRDLRERRGR